MNYTGFSSVEDFLEEASFRSAVFEKNEADVAYWNKFLRENPHLFEYASEARKILLSVKGEDHQVAQPEIDLAIMNVMRRIRPVSDRNEFSFKFWAKVAASVAVVASVALGVYNLLPVHQPSTALNKSPLDQFDVIKNESDKEKLVRFPDGSSAMLASNSTIKFLRSFDSSKREVHLSGEAFFEVAKNPQWPFVVYSNELVTEVLGTSFLVSAYPDAKKFEVRVKTGKVKLFHKDSSGISKAKVPAVTLIENEKGVLNRDVGLITNGKMQNQLKSQTPVVFSRTFNFKRTNVAEVFEILEQSYNIKIVYDKDVVKHCTLTASLGDEPLQEKLNMITASLDASYVISGDSVRLTSLKPCK